MSEIDFEEIEKAMAELINKAQGKQREKDLDKVSSARAEKAKKIETEQNQGDLATKRIIVAGRRMRSPAPRKSNNQTPPNVGGPKHMDFKAPAQTRYAPINNDPNLTKTVGELSNEFLLSDVKSDSANAETTPLPEKDLAEDMAQASTKSTGIIPETD